MLTLTAVVHHGGGEAVGVTARHCTVGRPALRPSVWRLSQPLRRQNLISLRSHRITGQVSLCRTSSRRDRAHSSPASIWCRASPSPARAGSTPWQPCRLLSPRTQPPARMQAVTHVHTSAVDQPSSTFMVMVMVITATNGDGGLSAVRRQVRSNQAN